MFTPFAVSLSPTPINADVGLRSGAFLTVDQPGVLQIQYDELGFS